MDNIEFAVNTADAEGLMRLQQADSPCKKIYFVLQLMYVFEEPHKLHALFFSLLQDVQKAAPTTSVFTSSIGECVMNDDYFGALDIAQQLIEYEQKIIQKAA